jgi:hypothetical protein
MPQWRIPYVFRALVDGLRIRCAQREGAPVGQGYELGEGVGAFRALEQRRVADLGGLPHLRLYGPSQGAQGAH